MPRFAPSYSLNPLTGPWRRPFVVMAALLVFALVAGTLDRIAVQQARRDQQQLRERVELNAAQKQALLEGELASIQQLVDALVTYISSNHANHSALESADVDVILSVLYQYTPHVRSIALAPDNRIAYVYPVQGNEKALGVYYPALKDQWPAVERMIREQRPVLAGPIRLVQGGVGLAHRTPVMLRNGRYWGLLSVVIDSDRLFRDAGLMAESGVDYALRGKDGQGARGPMILGRPELFDPHNVLVPIRTSAGQWQLAARPRQGWEQPTRGLAHSRGLAVALGLLVSGLSGWLLHLLSIRLMEAHRQRLAQFTLDKAIEAILWIHEDGSLSYQNETAAQMSGDPAGPTRRGSIWDLPTGFTREAWARSWQTLKERGTYALECSVLRDGHRVHLETTLNLLQYHDRELAVCFLRDITARKSAESSMRDSQQRTAEALGRARRLAYIVDHTSSAVLLTDREGRVRWCNQAFRQVSGYGLEEIVGRKPGDVLQGPLTRPETARFMHERLEQLQGFRVEVLNYRKDGVPFWVDLEVQPMLDDKGVVDGFMSVQIDITAHKRSEQRLEEAQRIAQMGFWEYDVEQGTALWSAETYRIYDLPPDKLVDATTVRLVIHPDDLAGFQEALQQAIADERPIYNECRIVHSSGEVRHVRHIGRRMPPDQTQRVKLFGTVQDITQQKRAEGLKNEFVSVVSHELRTPLTSIRGALGLMDVLLRETIPPQSRHLLDVANRNCERLLLLINDLLDMEKISCGKMEIRLQTQALLPLLQQAVLANAPYAQRYGVQFNLWVEGEPGRVRVDAHRLQQVMSNLLSNAAKFSGTEQEPMGSARVDVLVQNLGPAVRVSVQDYGVGIQPDQQHRIFQSFSQVDASNARARGGTGLGLAITKALIERMGGQVGFFSVADAGSTFWFELPLAD